ncbi:MBL fold metallo-hydrolase [Marivirga harenae]|uniref:MBL fold metallo-hydrolase n=1 Tax=Marivirga harenae TaxID=2010992 RepID=UPI0026E0A6DF|nr:MBL fold metallo-hydrolase [Marivirga harenae]WKV11227.1 MBL fold metallo-hydrolase [Marivirga harenae]
MKNIILVFCCFITLNLNGQDIIKTNDGDIKIHPIVHGTLALEYKEFTIYVDPYGGAEGFKGLNDADLILITDIHGDHLNKKTLTALNTKKSHFVVPEAVAKQMEGIDNSEIEILNNDNSTSFKGIKITAVPMYNLPVDAETRAPQRKGKWLFIEYC